MVTEVRPSTSPTPPHDDRLEFGQLLDMLASGWRTIAGCTVLGLVLALTYVVLSPNVYRGDVLLQVEQKPQLLPGIGELGLNQARPTVAEIELLGSRLVLGDVVDQLELTVVVEPAGPIWRPSRVDGNSIALSRLDVPPEWVGRELRLRVVGGDSFELAKSTNGQLIGTGRVGNALHGADDKGFVVFVNALNARPGAEYRLLRRHRLEVIDELRELLKIRERSSDPYISTGILEVAMEHEDPALITRVLDAVANVYLRQNVERRSEEARLSLAFLEQQMPGLRQELERAEEAFNRFRREHQAVDLSADTHAMLERLVEVETELKQAQVTAAELSLRYGAQHPEMRALASRRESLASVRAELEAQIDLLPDRQQDLMRLQRDVEVNTHLYTNLLNNQQELKVVQAGTIGNVRIVDRAAVALEPVRPRRVVAFAGGLAGGFMLGAVIVFARTTLRRTVTDPERLEQRLGYPIYAVIPRSRAQRRLSRTAPTGFALLAHEQPDDLAVEALRSLRTSLVFALARKPANIVALTSPGPDAGKTFTAANLAFLSAQSGQRVLLIDADLRRGHAHQYFGRSERGTGLSELLAGSATFADVVMRAPYGASGLDVLTTGTLPPNPSELLMQAPFAAMLAGQSADYDLVLIDTAPLLAVTDGLLAAALAGSVLVVARAGRARESELRIAIRRLAQNGAPISGLVVNDFDPTRAGTGYGPYQYDYR
jgi:tyrosine-protein kinase Etk/Wzc